MHNIKWKMVTKRTLVLKTRLWYNYRTGILGIRIKETKMYNTIVNEKTKLAVDIPKVFWKYYDLYRREEISLKEYSAKSNLTKDELLRYLSIV